MYNFYGNSTFKVGNRVRTGDTCGLDSSRDATVVSHFNWRLEAGAYKEPDDDWIPIVFDNGDVSYFPKGYLKKI